MIQLTLFTESVLMAVPPRDLVEYGVCGCLSPRSRGVRPLVQHFDRWVQQEAYSHYQTDAAGFALMAGCRFGFLAKFCIHSSTLHSVPR